MSIKSDFLANRLQDYLNRKAVPNSLQNKPREQAEEAGVLLSVLMKYSPKENEGVFWDNVKAYLEEEATSRAWPTGAELKKACLACRPKAERTKEGSQVVDTYAVNARRFADGDAVGDEWLFGRRAREIVAKGLVSESRIDEYRQALFASFRQTWGQDLADLRIAELWQRHSDADGRPALDAPPEPKFKHIAAE